jgi:hypothetical protein
VDAWGLMVAHAASFHISPFMAAPMEAEARIKVAATVSASAGTCELVATATGATAAGSPVASLRRCGFGFGA